MIATHTMPPHPHTLAVRYGYDQPANASASVQQRDPVIRRVAAEIVLRYVVGSPSGVAPNCRPRAHVITQQQPPYSMIAYISNGTAAFQAPARPRTHTRMIVSTSLRT